MSTKTLLNFKEYFIYEFLDRALAKVNEISDPQVQSQVVDFVKAIRTSSDFIDGVETLAQFPGTSDLSIFFADIFENISIYQPDEIHTKLDELSADMIEMFKLLKNDDLWISSMEKFKSEVGGLYGYETELSEEKLSLNEFCDFWIKNRFNELFSSVLKGTDEFELAKQFFNMLNTYPNVSHLVNLTDDQTVSTVIEQFINIIDYRSGQVDPYFFDNFYNSIDSFLDDLIRIVEEKNEIIKSLISKISEDELGEMEAQAKQLEDKISSRKFATKDDEQLKGVISEYITKEFNETLNDIMDILGEIVEDNQNEKLWDEFEDNAGYLTEMGSIHSISVLESLGNLLKNMKDELSKVNLLFDQKLYEIVTNLLTHLKEFTDKITEFSEENIANLIDKKTIEIQNYITEQAIAKNIEEDKYSLSSHREKVLEQFKFAHEHYWGLIAKEYARWLSHRDRHQQAENLVFWLEQLEFWYFQLGMAYVKSAIDYMKIIFKKLQYGEVSTNLDAYLQEFLMTVPTSMDSLNPEFIENFIQKVQREGIVLEKEHKFSFNEVKSDLYQFIIGSLRDSLEKVEHTNEILELLDDFSIRLQLNNESDALQLISSFKSVINQHSDIWLEQDFRAKIKSSIEQFFDFLSSREFIAAEKAINSINDKSLSYKFEQEVKISTPTITLVEEEDSEEVDATFEEVEEDELESLFQEEVEEAESEEDATAEEEITDEDLQNIFKREAQKYLNNAKEALSSLKDNPENIALYQTVFENYHALKGSAKMMGEIKIGDLAEILEDLFEEAIDSSSVFSERLIDEVIEISDNLLNDNIDTYNADELKTKLRALIELSGEEEKESAELITLSEQDEDLLQIFDEETGDVIKQLKGISNYLKEYALDKKVKLELEQALHKINSAAKMLGFSEIGSIIDKLNDTLLSIEEIPEEKFYLFLNMFKQSTQVIELLAKEKKIGKDEYESLMTQLDLVLAKKYDELEKSVKIEDEKEAKSVDENISSVAEELKEEKSADERKKDVIQLFVNEVNEQLQQLRDAYLALEMHPDSRDALYQLFRLMHTIKGAASMVGMDKISSLAHKFEDCLEYYHSSESNLPFVLLSTIEQGIEEFEYILGNLTKNEREISSPRYNILLTNLEKILKFPNELEGSEEKPVSPDAIPALNLKNELKEQEIIKIPIQKLDELLNNSVELVITNNELSNYISKMTNELKRLEEERKELTELKNLSQDIFQHYQELFNLMNKISKDSTSPQTEVIKPSLENLMNKLQSMYNEIKTLESGIKTTLKDFEMNFEKTNKIGNRLYDDILQVRMVPISLLFGLFPRAIDEISKKYNKKVELVIEGGETELDRSMVEHLFEPLLHIVRNAIDHGIETLEERKKAKKSDVGKIYLRAKQEKDTVIITIEDDGRGIDFNAIKKKIIDKKILTKKEADKLSNDELIRFLFQPRFSTREDVSEISGRGIGLDVVERQVRKIKGEIKVETEPGKSTKFHLKFPITLSVTHCILVRVEDTYFGIPLYFIETTFEIKGSEIFTKDEKIYYKLEDRQMELLYLNEIMNLGPTFVEKQTKDATFSVLKLRSRGHEMGLLVDKIDRRAELIVKPLSQNLQNFPYLTGGAVLPSGDIALIIDADELIEKQIITGESSYDEQKQKKSIVLFKKLTKRSKIKFSGSPSILVLDDSESVRSYMKNLIEDLGYEVHLAANTEEGYNILRNNKVDLIIVDLELPEISGYEFILNISKEKELKSIPFMFFTGKKVEVIENLAKDLNALGYILKPFDEELFNEVFKKMFVEIEK